LLDLLCLGIDACTLPGHLWYAAIMRGLVITPVCLAGILLLTRRLPWPVEGLAVGLPTLLILVVSWHLGTLAGGVHFERYCTAALVACFAATIIPNMTVRSAAVHAMLSVVLFELMVLGRPGQGFVANIELVTLYPMAVLAAVHFRARMERIRRRNFLLTQRDALRVRELARANQQFLALSNTDPLTGVFNRRFFDSQCLVAWRAAEQSNGWMSVLLIDIDQFTALNDRLGHAQGDQYLREVAGAIGAGARAGIDIIARFGTDEFAALLPGADNETATSIAERIRCSIDLLKLSNPGTLNSQHLTVSVGIATMRTGDDPSSPERLLAAARAALIAAKTRGRDPVNHPETSRIHLPR
jgi:diguanylate cyclase (GGDEF)-like protein